MPPESFFGTLAGSIDSMAAFTPAQQRARLLLEGPQRYSCLVGGARAGKTFLAVWSIVDVASRAPGSRHAMLRYRANAARASLALDTLPAVVRACFPTVRIEEHRQDGFFELANGSQIWISGLDDKDRVEKILGQEYLTVYLNEASQIPYSSALIAFTRLAQMVPGFRQRAIVDLNPVAKTHWTNVLFGEKRDPISKRSLADPENYERAFLNPTDNAANLSPEYVASLATLPERQRKRFYEGAYVDDLEGALWTLDTIERSRRSAADLPDMRRIVVAIDPAVSSGENSDETGIIVAGLGMDGHGYVLADGSGKFTPTQWAGKAVRLYRDHEADRIVAETNQGGAMVESTIRAVDSAVPYRGVHASRGKIVRAEPISALYEQGKVHHVGAFPELEDQLTSFMPGSTGSPDRLDAMVWALTDLMDGAGNTGMIDYYEMLAAEVDKPREIDVSTPFRCIAPWPGGTLILITGRTIQVGADCIVDCNAEEALPLRALGYQVPPLPDKDNGYG